MCPCCNRMKRPNQPEPEETEALTDLRTIGEFMNQYDEAAEAHFEFQNNNEEKRYAR